MQSEINAVDSSALVPILEEALRCLVHPSDLARKLYPDERRPEIIAQELGREALIAESITRMEADGFAHEGTVFSLAGDEEFIDIDDLQGYRLNRFLRVADCLITHVTMPEAMTHFREVCGVIHDPGMPATGLSGRYPLSDGAGDLVVDMQARTVRFEPFEMSSEVTQRYYNAATGDTLQASFQKVFDLPVQSAPEAVQEMSL